MSIKEILDNASHIIHDNATELHIVGGLHPELGLDYYIDMIGSIHERFPDVHIQALEIKRCRSGISSRWRG
jgi:aminodeoxyfutalosine synthase